MEGDGHGNQLGGKTTNDLRFETLDKFTVFRLAADRHIYNPVSYVACASLISGTSTLYTAVYLAG
jgi:hypothetical protein